MSDMMQAGFDYGALPVELAVKSRAAAERIKLRLKRTVEDIIEIGRHVYQKGWVAANDGNISVRLDSERLLCTPTGVSKGMMSPDDLIIVDMKGNKIAGKKQRTSEIMMHLTVYNMRPDIRAVVHAHPRHAIALSFETATFVPGDLEGQLHLKEVPVVAAGPLQVEQIAAGLRNHLVVLLRGHGAYARGQTLWEALHWITALEESAHIAWLRAALPGRE